MTAPAKQGFNVAAHGLRGLAALGVLFAHMLGGAGEHIYAAHPTYNAAVAPYWNLGTFAVFLFFVISGFVILPSALRYSPREFAIHRFVRIYPLFFAFTLLFLILNVLTNYEPSLNDPVTILSAFSFLNLFTGTDQLTPNAWSLTYEVMFYALTALGVWVAFSIRSQLGLIAFAVLACAFVWFWPKALFFIGGLLVRVVHDRDWRASEGLANVGEVVSLVVLVAFAAGAKRSFHQLDFLDWTNWATLVSACVYFYFATSANSLTGKLLDNRLIAYLGLVSYSLYLAHPYTYLPIRILFDRAGLFTENVVSSMTLFFVVVTAVTMLVTHFVYLVFERWPYRACFHRSVYQQPEKAPIEVKQPILAPQSGRSMRA